MVPQFLKHPLFKASLVVSVVILSLGIGLVSHSPFYLSHFLLILPYVWIGLTLLTSGLLVWQVGLMRAGFLIGLTLGIAAALELGGVTTGWPFGFFRYPNHLGPKILGLVPWSMLFFWLPTLLSSRILSQYFSRRWYSFMVGAVLLTILDLTLDPVAVKLNLWHWLNSSWYYQVPELNFGGGLVTYLILSGILSFFIPQDRSETNFYYAFIFWATLTFWSVMALTHQLWGPGLIGLSSALWILRQLFQKPELVPQKEIFSPSISPRGTSYRQRKKQARTTQQLE